MRAFTIAAAQSSSKKGAVEANVQTHTEFVRVAAEHNVDLIVFPELSLAGYEPEIARDTTIAVDDARLLPLKEQAERFDMTIVVGAPVPSSGEKPHIGALIFDAGNASVYAKQFLHPSDSGRGVREEDE
ncbi:MAG: carbon-nitrogen hydrolase family protein [Phycisphaerales bacterium]|nr:MAG: carbon-nitrogen hydrolase family protein [Phycisphaerales bacterium]